MAKADESYMQLVLGFDDAKELVKTCIEAKQPIMLWGKPGIGKSDLIRLICKELNRPFIDVRLPLYESVDLKGYPYLKEEKVKRGEDTGKNSLAFALTEELPWDHYKVDDNSIILFDEINGAMQSTMLASYQLILDRGIGGARLAKNVAMVAAGNREADKGATSQMPKPLENRFFHVEVEPTFDSWVNYAIARGVNVMLLGFLAKNQTMLNAFDPQKSSRAFGTPRSWMKLNDVLELHKDKNISDELLRNLIAAAVGLPTANQVMAFKKIAHKIPEAMDVLKGKAANLKKEDTSVDVAYMLVTNVLYKLRDLHEEHRRKSGNEKYELTDELAGYTNNFIEYLMDNEKSLGEEFMVIPISIASKNFGLPLNQLKIPAVKKLMVKTKGALNTAFKS